MFLNLLINAIDACVEQGGLVRVTARSDDGHVVVRIEDNGIGMAPEVADRAFDLFFTTKEAGQGTGLGLATVHSLIEAHGGTLDLETTEGEGTTFIVRLPALETPSQGADR